MYVKGLLLFLSAVAALTTVASPTFAQSKPAVTVVNTAANPVPVTGTVMTVPEARPSDTAVQFSLDLDSGRFCGDTATSNNFYVVPAGNRLVIEFVSAQALTDSQNSMLGVSLLMRVGPSNNFSHFIPLEKQVGILGTYYAGAVPMRAYADAGTTVCADTRIISEGPIRSDIMTVSGYLEPQP